MVTCRRCGHEWKPRKKPQERTKRCPNCTSPAWDRDLKRRGGWKPRQTPFPTVAVAPKAPLTTTLDIDIARELVRRIYA